jgi:plastocyanin
MKRTILLACVISVTGLLQAQFTHQLELTAAGFVPDTLNLAPGDSIHVTIPKGHSMVQIPMDQWEQEVVVDLIGIALGTGTVNFGTQHIFNMDSLGTFYYVCQQHPSEKGIIVVDEMNVGIAENSLPSFELHPRPASDRITIGSSIPYAGIRIDDRQGRHVATLEPSGDNSLDVSQFTTGLYFLTLLDRGGVPVARDRMIISR